MTARQRLARSVGAAVIAVTAAACAPVTVTSLTERGIQVESYRTYGWGSVDTAVLGDPRLDNNTFFHEYLRGAIDRHLLSRGYEPSVVGADLHVHYHASTRQKIYISGQEPTGERCRDCAVEVYDAGTLLIDLTDARTGALVWRGAAEAGLAGVVNNQTKMEETIERIVGRIMAQLPRRS